MQFPARSDDYDIAPDRRHNKLMEALRFIPSNVTVGDKQTSGRKMYEDRKLEATVMWKKHIKIGDGSNMTERNEQTSKKMFI